MGKESVSRLLDRFLEILPGLLVWSLLTAPIWLSPHLPEVVAVLILFFVVYWFYRAVKTSILSWVGFKKMRRAMKTDWLGKLNRDFAGEWEEYTHLFIIPTYKERGYILETTFRALSRLDYPLDKIYVVLAMEERDDEQIKAEKRAVAEKYRDVFAGVYVTEHPHQPGEVVGPGSNRTWAMKKLLPKLEQELNIQKTIVTTLDADFVVHRKLLGALMYTYLVTPKAERKTFTGVFLYLNNYWQAPAVSRLIASSIMVSQLAELNENWKYVNFSSHSINLQSLEELGFWSTRYVNDDSRFYWKALYAFGEEYEVVPYWIPIYADAVLDEGFIKTLENQYKQLQRWAYGVENIPMIVRKAFTSDNISPIRRLERLLFAFRSYLIWATVSLITGLGAFLLTTINPGFARTALGNNLTFYSGAIMTMAMVGLLNAIYINERIVPSRPKDWSRVKKLFSYFQWILSPLVFVTFGTFPAIDAQTRLMFGKYLSFRVTMKYRQK